MDQQQFFWTYGQVPSRPVFPIDSNMQVLPSSSNIQQPIHSHSPNFPPGFQPSSKPLMFPPGFPAVSSPSLPPFNGDAFSQTSLSSEFSSLQLNVDAPIFTPSVSYAATAGATRTQDIPTPFPVSACAAVDPVSLPTHQQPFGVADESRPNTNQVLLN
jgi:hypothetical protein